MTINLVLTGNAKFFCFFVTNWKREVMITTGQ